VFGVYEVFGNLIPGFILLASFLVIGHNIFNLNLSQLGLSDSILAVVSVFVAFSMGVAVQSFSSLLGGKIQHRKYGGYPSALYLGASDGTFPASFKENVRKLAQQRFGTLLDAPAGHVFDLCYTYVVQKIGSVRVSQFLALYTFSRSMMITMFVEAAILLGWAVGKDQYQFALVALVTVGVGYLFYRRFLTYSESFAKEVYRSFIVG
jgi:hypothetical protein